MGDGISAKLYMCWAAESPFDKRKDYYRIFPGSNSQDGTPPGAHTGVLSLANPARRRVATGPSGSHIDRRKTPHRPNRDTSVLRQSSFSCSARGGLVRLMRAKARVLGALRAFPAAAADGQAEIGLERDGVLSQ